LIELGKERENNTIPYSLVLLKQEKLEEIHKVVVEVLIPYSLVLLKPYLEKHKEMHVKEISRFHTL